MQIGPGETITLRVTRQAEAVGYAMLWDKNKDAACPITGNVTYFIRSGGKTSDCISVLPATEFYFASIPFDDFSSLCLALVASGWTSSPTEVVLRLYSAKGTLLKTRVMNQTGFTHVAQFGWELFPDTFLDKGRLEIEADSSVHATALMLREGQLSALPVESAPFVYSVRRSDTDEGRFALWPEGSFVKGWVYWKLENGQPMQFPYRADVTGFFYPLVDKRLILVFSDLFGMKVQLCTVEKFTFSLKSFQGTYEEKWFIEGILPSQGTMRFERICPAD